MSHRYSHGGDYRQGGYNSGYRGGYQNYGKINEDDVPESQHSIFIRGLPSSLNYDEIKNFFEDNIGPCSFDFQKINYERQSLFVAVRFESKDHAREAYDKYRDSDILGCRCEVTWFRDIRRYISYQQQNGLTIRRGNFGRSNMGRYHNSGRPDYRKRRYSDDRRSRSKSYSDSDRSRSRSRRSSRSRSSRSRSRSEGERSTSRESDRRPRSDSKDDKKRKKEKKVKKAKKERQSRRSGSASSRSDGERSRSSSREGRDRSDSRKKSRKGRDDSPASSTGSPLRMTPPPPAPIIGPIIPSATSATSTPAAPTEKPGPLSEEVVDISEEENDFYCIRERSGRKHKKKRSGKSEGRGLDSGKDGKITITIANKATVPVENTSFKMQLDSDEPPRKIIRAPLTPPPAPPKDDAMEVDEKEEEVPIRKENVIIDPKEKGGWRTVGDNSGPPSDVAVENHTAAPPAPTLVEPSLAKTNASPEKHANGFDMVPRSVSGPTPVGTPNPPPPKKPPMGTPTSLPPPPGRPSMGGGLNSKYPEMGKVIKEIKSTQDALVNSIKPNPLRLSLDLSSGESVQEKMEERERLIRELDPTQKSKFDLKMKQITNSYKGDASTITTVVKSVVQKDAALEDQIKPALMAVLEDLEKQIYKKVDDFLACGL